jgi:uncharacterized protein with PIN domain
MAVQVLEGPTKWVTQCQTCSSVLSFEKEDVAENVSLTGVETENYINCPHCKKEATIYWAGCVTLELYKNNPTESKEKFKKFS